MIFYVIFSFINIGSVSLTSINQTHYDPFLPFHWQNIIKFNLFIRFVNKIIIAIGLETLAYVSGKPSLNTKYYTQSTINCETCTWSRHKHNNQKIYLLAKRPIISCGLQKTYWLTYREWESKLNMRVLSEILIWTNQTLFLAPKGA